MKTMMKRMTPVAAALCLILLVLFVPRQCSAASFTKSAPEGVMATAVNTRIAVSWEKVSGAKGYIVYEKAGNGKLTRVAKVTSCKVIRKNMTRGVTYGYAVRAWTKKGNSYLKTKKSAVRYTTVASAGVSTVKNFLRTALAPMGSTMYVWGGGWNKADNGAGTPAHTVGTSPRWRAFAATKTKYYNYNNYRYQINSGLDCSGYVGWLMYNTLHTVNGSKGFVKGADKQGKWFADLGYGSWTKARKVKKHQAGDIMSGPEHIWISLGECRDGSTVVLHCSPAGVKLSGTYSRSGVKNSQAAKLARKYMKKYYPSWYSRFPSTTLTYGSSYSRDYGRFRWSSKKLADPEKYRSMSADKVLADLFGER